MKALFRNHFPFVEGTPIEELTPEQKLIKYTYDKLYSGDIIHPDTIVKKSGRSDTVAYTKGNRLREVHADEQSTEGNGE